MLNSVTPFSHRIAFPPVTPLSAKHFFVLQFIEKTEESYEMPTVFKALIVSSLIP